jgi:hypothetical protein
MAGMKQRNAGGTGSREAGTLLRAGTECEEFRTKPDHAGRNPPSTATIAPSMLMRATIGLPDDLKSAPTGNSLAESCGDRQRTAPQLREHRRSYIAAVRVTLSFGLSIQQNM